MASLVYVLCLLALFGRSLADPAEKCDPEVCTASKNCRCSSTASPLSEGDPPQLISVTVTGSVVDRDASEYYLPIFTGRNNPDGNPISGTFFISHEYTDYVRVNELYQKGLEIAVNSITRNSLFDYWQKADQETLVNEFLGQRTILSTFANIPINDIVGLRSPIMQIGSDVAIEAYKTSGLQYDSSWISRSNSMFYPYTLDYATLQECATGETCPKESHPGFWVSPVVNLQGNGSLECNFLDNCFENGTAREISDWLLSQVDRVRSSTRAPMTILLPAAWFLTDPAALEGFELFLDTVLDLGDVFVVSVQEAVNWAKNPVPASQFRTTVPVRTATCNAGSCTLKNVNGDERYMMSCVTCPSLYPWLGNPLGDANGGGGPLTTGPANPVTTQPPPPTLAPTEPTSESP